MFAIGANLKTWLKLLIENEFNLSLLRIPQIFIITVVIVFLTPIEIIEKLLFKRKIKKIKMKIDPLFILGHWRQGTTFLHELLIRNPNHSYMTMFESIFPNHFLYFDKFIKRIFGWFLPSTRPQDDVKIGVDAPHEHGFAIANLCSMSVYSGTYFPLNQEYYNRYAAGERLSNKEKKKLRYYYEYIIKKLYYKNGDKLLILKDPIDTANIDFLLELFPNAKFVHIIRNPYEVFFSTKKLHEKTIPIFRLQKGYPDLEKLIFNSYRDIYEKFYQDLKLIPKENFVEVKYEDFIKNPLTQLKLIYDKLDLKGFEESLPEIQAFLNQEADYSRSKYRISKKDKLEIYSHWGKIIEIMGYKKPETIVK